MSKDRQIKLITRLIGVFSLLKVLSLIILSISPFFLIWGTLDISWRVTLTGIILLIVSNGAISILNGCEKQLKAKPKKKKTFQDKLKKMTEDAKV